MRQQVGGSGYALWGVAVLAACACNVSSGLARLADSYGIAIATYGLQPAFVAVAAVLILAGLWQRVRRVVPIAFAGIVLLAIGELVVPPMSFGVDTQLTARQLWGLAAYVAAGVLLVMTFFRSYPSKNPRASLTAMSGLALATGCNCCLVTMGVAGLLHALVPSQTWLMQTLTLYALAAILMGIGLFRLGGVLPAVTAVAGQAIVLAGLKLSIPELLLNGLRVDFLIKYPMMLLGAGVVVGGFVVAYREREIAGKVTQLASFCRETAESGVASGSAG